MLEFLLNEKAPRHISVGKPNTFPDYMASEKLFQRGV
jgi:hypothetical protein